VLLYVALTPEMLAGTNCPARKGHLAKPLILGQQMGNAVFMDGFGVYYIES
jgi:hypothetical protein